jgi:inner membrane protein
LFVLLAVSHVAMDMATNGGLGIALFSPFDAGRHFWGRRRILVSPIGLMYFLLPWGWAAIMNEARWFGPKLTILVTEATLIRCVAC